MTMQFKTLREKIAHESTMRKQRAEIFRQVFDEANRAGFAAGEAVTPSVMGVRNEMTGQTWIDREGPCGFAWVRVRPGTSAFAKWLVKNGRARRAHAGGVDIWISAHEQSMERKSAHAVKMAEMLRAKLGIDGISAGSRMD